jgi:hypothetical protein
MGMNIYGMNDHFMRSLQDRYEVIYDLPPPTAMIHRAEASKAATMITVRLGLQRFMRYWENSSARALECMVSITSYWKAYTLDIPRQWVKAMAMMNSSERKPPSTPPRQDEPHTITGDLMEISMSNLDNYRHLVRVTSAKLAGRMQDISEVATWRTLSHGLCLLSLLFSVLHYLFGSRPSTKGFGTWFNNLRESSVGGGSLCAASAKRLP